MSDAAFFQSNFLGGEISPETQGDFNDPRYSQSLALCRNNIVLPTGSVERRQGSRWLGYIDSGATLRDVILDDGTPLVIEFAPVSSEYYRSYGGSAPPDIYITSGGLHLFAPPGTVGVAIPTFLNGSNITAPMVPVFDEFVTVASIDTSSPAIFTLSAAPSIPWAINDRVTIYIDDPVASTASILRAQTFKVQMLTATTFTLVGMGGSTAPIDGSAIVNRTGYQAIWVGHHIRWRSPSIIDYAPYIENITAYLTGGSNFLDTIGTVYGQYNQYGGTQIDADDVRSLVIIPTAGNQIFFLFPKIMPWVLNVATKTQPTFTDAGFNFGVDGPWMDPRVNGPSVTGNYPLTIVPNEAAAPATMTLISVKCPDTGAQMPEFENVICRAIRMWSQPPAWDAATAYAAGDLVSYQNAAWYCQLAAPNSTGVQPGGSAFGYGTYANIQIPVWVIQPNAGIWVTGMVVGYDGTTGVSQIQVTSPQTIPAGYGNTIPLYQAGFNFLAYSQGTSFVGRGPLSGCWHEGRLWLGSGSGPWLTLNATVGYPFGGATAIGYNRFDASMADQTIAVGGPVLTGPVVSGILTANPYQAPVINPPMFSPTDYYGNVNDNNGISYHLNSNTAETLNWMQPNSRGILVGTNSAEWLITASALNDPLTPTSIQAQRQTTYGSRRVAPLTPGLAVIFVQLAGTRIIEYVADVFSQRFLGQALNERAMHLLNGAFRQDWETSLQTWYPAAARQLAFQREPIPYVWLCGEDGMLAGCLYRRLSHFGQTAPVLDAWSSHVLTNRYVLSIANARAVPGYGDVLMMATVDHLFGAATSGPAGIWALEMLTPRYGPNGHLGAAAFMDGMIMAGIDGLSWSQTNGSPNVVTIYGMAAHVGETRSLFMQGTYMGDYVVAADGSITYTASATLPAPGQWTSATPGYQYGEFVATGFKYQSQGQLLRPNNQRDLQSPTGPGVAKTRRFHMIGAQVQDTVEFGMGSGTDPYKAIVVPDLGNNPSFQYLGNVYQLGTIQPIPVIFPDGAAYTGDLDFPALLISHPLAYNGILWSPIIDEYSFDGMLAWQVSDPYPCRVLSVGGFLQAQDR